MSLFGFRRKVLSSTKQNTAMKIKIKLCVLQNTLDSHGDVLQILTLTFHVLWCQYGVKTEAWLETCYFYPTNHKIFSYQFS